MSLQPAHGHDGGMYLIKQLKSQGLGIKQLHIVFTALIVSRVPYFTLSLHGVAS